MVWRPNAVAGDPTSKLLPAALLLLGYADAAAAAKTPAALVSLLLRTGDSSR